MSPPPRRESFRTDSNRRCPGINRVLSPLTHGVLWRAFPQTPLLSTVCRMFHSVDSPGIAPGSPACKTGIFLLDHEPVLFRFPCIPEGAPSTEAVGLAPSTESLPYPLESQTPDPAGRLARTTGPYAGKRATRPTRVPAKPQKNPVSDDTGPESMARQETPLSIRSCTGQAIEHSKFGTLICRAANSDIPGQIAPGIPGGDLH